jgi:membrane associated rhomboid family serine protease
MLADRHYMRDGDGRMRQPLSVILMIVLVAVYALQCVDQVYLHTGALGWLALTTEGIRHGFLWQLITFQFLHGSAWHLLGNLLGLWFIGRFVESVLGKPRFALAYFGSGALGGLLQGLLMLLFPGSYGVLLYGASAGVSGVFAIFAMLEGHTEIRWNFILPIRARTLLWIYLAVEAFFTLVPAGRGVAHAAHLGGILAGIGFVKLGWHQDYVPLPWSGAWRRLRNRFRFGPRPGPKPFVCGTPFLQRRSKNAAPTSLPPGEFISREVDPILDKISAHGIQSLTEREKQILEAARARMARR